MVVRDEQGLCTRRQELSAEALRQEKRSAAAGSPHGAAQGTVRQERVTEEARDQIYLRILV